MLVVGVGDGCKELHRHLRCGKSYEAVGLLGFETDTLDALGEPTEYAPQSVVVEREMLIEALPKFRGDIEQVPPMFSALRHQGKRLYDLARQGVTVHREARPVQITRLELTTKAALPEFSLSVDCSGGTYIRSLVADIGREVGSRAHMTELVRTRANNYQLKDCMHLDETETTAEEVIQHLKSHKV